MFFSQIHHDRGGVAHGKRVGQGTAATRARILVVDDDAVARRTLEKLLRAEGFATTAASTGEEALAEARRALPDLLLSDLRMAGMDGLELCQRLHEIDPDLPIIVMTGYSDMESVIQSLRSGVEDYLVKPLQLDAVLWCLERAIKRRATKLENEEIQRTLNERLLLSSLRQQELADAEALQRAQQSALLEGLSDGVVIADASGRLRMINGAARTILGAGDQELADIDALQRYEAQGLDGQPLGIEQRPLARALRGEEFKDYEVVRMRPNGERRHVVSTGTSVRDGNGELALAIIVFRDVTELRRLEQQRAEYLALISHDLRNPLNVVMMAVGTMKTVIEQKRPVSLGLADRAERNSKRMTAMLDELREVTRLEGGGRVLEAVACDLRELVEDVVDSIDDARGRIAIETDDGPPYVVLAEAPRLERVIANLVTNALKYSGEEAPVKVRLVRRENAVELAVIDRGIGIAPESVKRLFDRYYRTPAGMAQASGLGLGLYIAHLIVEAHGGRIDVSSEVGKGSTFRLVLPPHTPAA